MVPPLSLPITMMTVLLEKTTQVLLILSFFLSFSFWMGWVQRWLWLFLEHQLTKLCNGTPVTLGSLDFNLWCGTAVATNVVLHQPEYREGNEWKWDSPLLARIGRLDIELNVSSLLFHLVYSLYTGVPAGTEPRSAVEVYSVVISDVQVFIERRQYIFNFYLLDRNLILPDPADILLPPQQQQQPLASNAGVSSKEAVPSDAAPTTTKSSINDSVILTDNDTNHTNDGNVDDADASKERAQELVSQIFSAVNSLGRAAQQGSLKSQLLKHKNKFSDKLKKLQDGPKSKVDAMQAGTRMIRHMGKAVKQQTKGVVKDMPKAPKRREDFVPPPPLYIRVGRVVLTDVRIFTKDNWNNVVDVPVNAQEKTTHDTNNDNESENRATAAAKGREGKASTHSSTQQDEQEPHNGHKSEQQNESGSWNKPIYIDQLVVRGTELCPPKGFQDDSKLPAIYQPLIKVIDVVSKRILTEIAKSNTGRLLNTAMGELTSFVKLSRSEGNKKAAVMLT